MLKRVCKRVWMVNSMAVFLFAGLSSAAAPGNKIVIAYSSLNERGVEALLVAVIRDFFASTISMSACLHAQRGCGFISFAGGRGTILFRFS